MPVDPLGIIIIGVDVALLLWLIGGPLVEKVGADKGDGMRHVMITPPSRVRLYRTAGFYLVAAILVLIVDGFAAQPIALRYWRTVSNVAMMVIREPAVLGGVTGSGGAGLRLAGPICIVSLAIVSSRASLLRRIAMAAHAFYLMALTVLTDAGLAVAAVGTGLPIGPTTVMGSVVTMFAFFVVMTRLVLSAYEVPRATTVPLLRKGLRDSVMMASALTAVTALYALGLLGIANSPLGRNPLMPLLAALSLSLVPTFTLLVLALAGAGRRPGPAVAGADIDVIVPAYNEAAGIAGTIYSIDDAAKRYPGRVHIYLCNDGSTDATAQIAGEAFLGCRYAEGTLLAGEHRGKAAALNMALAAGQAGLVVRIDADILVGVDAFRYTEPWFADPQIGMLGAFTLPRIDRPSWISRLRTFECWQQFGLSRLGQQTADAIACIPGTYTAVRRIAVETVGGFAEGMNGEDSDLTLQVGRLGYQVVIDTRVLSFEDVPSTVAGLREQRIRWNRAGWHCLARHNPFRAGMAGPRVWFSMLAGNYMRRFLGIMRPVLIMHGILIAVAVPEARHNLATVMAVVVALLVPSVLVAVALALRYGRTTALLWAPLLIVFGFLKRVFTLESMLSLPVRPLRSGWLRQRSRAVVRAVQSGNAELELPA